MVGLENCRSLFTQSTSKKMRTERYLGRHFLRIQQALEEADLDNVCRLPGVRNPAAGLTKVRSDMVPLLRLLESGRFNPGSSRPLKGLARRESNGCA